ncbi:MAG: acyltransferase family protein [Pseudomonadota bacterium]
MTDSPVQQPAAAAPVARLVGLDSIRFLCAAIVVFAHTGQPPLRNGIDTTHPIGRLVDAGLANIWSSAAAVIVFFVVSGFCIHHAYAERNRIGSLSEYYVRRYVRILIPAIGAILISAAIGLNLSLFEDSILWSIAAEIIYYTIYPALLPLRRRLGSWLPLIGIAFVLAFAVAGSRPHEAEYPMFGLQLNWLLGLPCWLLGCWLADLAASGRVWRLASFVWPLRLAAWSAMIGCSILRYHTPIGYPWTLNLFAILAALWLGAETAYLSRHPPPRWLEWCGRWSYSLYLTHKLTNQAIGWLSPPTLGPVLDWSLRFGLLLLGAYVFYLACEKPAHGLARRAGRWAAGLGATANGAPPPAASPQPALATVRQADSSLSK